MCCWLLGSGNLSQGVVRVVEILKLKKSPILHIRCLIFILLIIFHSQLPGTRPGTVLISLGLFTWTVAHWSNIMLFRILLGPPIHRIRVEIVAHPVWICPRKVPQCYLQGVYEENEGSCGCFKSLYLT